MKKYLASCLFFLSFILASTSWAATVSYTPAGNKILESRLQGEALPGAPDYAWWYGCTPTSAGMMVGYYDRSGYEGLRYDNLVPGGTAESSSYGNPGANANSVIASQGHINDFYSGAYLAEGDDVPPPYHPFDSLADFMGTSQDALGNPNGATQIWNYTDGTRLYASDLVTWGLQEYSGLYGIWEYLAYAGYGEEGSLTNLFNQYIYGYNSNSQGFTFDDYKSEIDAGRPVMIQVEGHSMFGYGYDAATNEILLHDTWSEGEHRMAWGGSYSGMQHYAVTIFEPSGGDPVPLPGALYLLGSGLLALLGLRRRREGPGMC